MISSGQIQQGTLVWKQGMTNWVPAVQSELGGYFRAPAAAPRPMAAPRPVGGVVNPYAAPVSYPPAGYTAMPHDPLTWMQILFSFEGRILRWQWWVSALIQMGILFGGMLLAGGLGQLEGDYNEMSPMAMGVILVMFVLIVWIGLAVGTKRWHDRGKSGWMVLVSFIPFGGIWVLIECGMLEGTPGTNQYGTDPAGRLR